MEDGNCFAVTNQHSSAVYVRSAEFPLFEMEIRVLSAPLGYVACVSALMYTDVGRRYRTGASRPMRRSRGDLLARSTRGRVSARRALPAPRRPDPTRRRTDIRFRTRLENRICSPGLYFY